MKISLFFASLLTSIFFFEILCTTKLFGQKINVIFQNNSNVKGMRKFKLQIENPDGTKKMKNLV